jgi:hypothetical protein
MFAGFGPGLAFAATNIEAAQQIVTNRVLRIIGFLFSAIDEAARLMPARPNRNPYREPVV